MEGFSRSGAVWADWEVCDLRKEGRRYYEQSKQLTLKYKKLPGRGSFLFGQIFYRPKNLSNKTPVLLLVFPSVEIGNCSMLAGHGNGSLAVKG